MARSNLTSTMSATRTVQATGAMFSAILAAVFATFSGSTNEASAAVDLQAYEAPAQVEVDGIGDLVDGIEEAQAAKSAPEIVDWPIVYDDERANLTAAHLAYRGKGFERTGDDWADATIVPRVVVLHHTAGPTAESAWNTFNKASTGRSGLRDDQKLNTSTQFVVDRDGTIYRLYPENLAGRHAIGLNHLSIGVENVGGIEGYPLTDAQVEANVELIRYLHDKYPTITHVIGHHEYRAMESHPYFDEVDPKFRTVKSDPGAAFMTKVRDGLDDLELAGAPTPKGKVAKR